MVAPQASASSSCSSVSTSTSSACRCAAPARTQLDRGGDAAGRGDVVVLDHRAVEEAEAVRRAAAVHHGLLLEGAQAGRGLARRGDARLGAGGLGDVGGRQGRHAAQPAEEVERRALGGEDRRQRAAQLGDDVAGGEALAVADDDLHGERRVDQPRRLLERGHAGEHAGLARDHAGDAVAGEDRPGEVAVAGEVLAQGAPRGRPRRLPVARARAVHRSAARLTPAPPCRRPRCARAPAAAG